MASVKRSGGNDKAHSNYCKNLNKAINEAARVLKKSGTMSFIYSHSSVLGWQAIIKAFRHSAMTFTSVQPLSIERKQRPRAIKSDAVNTCIAFIARKSPKPKRAATLDDMMISFDKIINSNFTKSLSQAGWCDEDIAIGLMAHGVALVSNIECIEDADDILALLRIEDEIKGRFPKFKLAKRKSL